MKYLFIGDIYGKPGREIVKELLPRYIEKYNPDYVFANTENLSHGKGIRIPLLDDLQEIGVNAFTGGNHSFRHKDIYTELENSQRQIRPANYPEGTPGKGYIVLDDKVLLINVMGNVFMKDSLSCPFRSVETIIDMFADSNYDVILDIHGEASSEKRAIAEYFDGRISAVVGTHTHVQTNDSRILSSGTGFITDIGMNGSQDSIIGVKKEIIINNFLTQIGQRHEIAEGRGEFAAIYIETENNKCIRMDNILDRD